jgi:hypothetical protein
MLQRYPSAVPDRGRLHIAVIGSVLPTIRKFAGSVNTSPFVRSNRENRASQGSMSALA